MMKKFRSPHLETQFLRCQSVIKFSKLKFNGPKFVSRLACIDWQCEMCVGTHNAKYEISPGTITQLARRRKVPIRFQLRHKILRPTMRLLRLFLRFHISRCALQPEDTSRQRNLFKQLLFFCPSFYHYIRR